MSLAHSPAYRRVLSNLSIPQKVLPHDQAHNFSGAADEEHAAKKITWSERINTITCCCGFCKRRKKHAVGPEIPDTETAENILERYREKSHEEKFAQKSSCKRCRCHKHAAGNENESENEPENDPAASDDLTPPEVDGDSGVTPQDDEEMRCHVCFGSFEVGEEVSWSKFGYCKHVYHYECILPWLLLGHVRCPVCREPFWGIESNFDLFCHAWFNQRPYENKATLELRRSTFCVQHGLVSPESA